ncbi:unnamed protein product [Phytophthora fragariaefolia]|uniref:Unnamed protein product n=1 Tax=Phytophthora fragariaefolia TaxID=1490495 RepID=A0A9W6Y7I7_9STRA|nr:unnamed protein product [Phytophthora fragariaefolia]
MEYALAFVDENNLFFEPMHDVVHVDEKWFYEDEVKHTYYVVGDEEVPQRVVAAGKKGGWNIRLLCQRPNSPDFNVLDFEFFASIQSLQLRKGSRGIQKLVNTVKQAYLEIDVGTLEDVSLSLQACMICALQCHGGNGYKLPHMSKNKLRCEGKYPNALSVGKELYEQVAKEVNWLL